MQSQKKFMKKILIELFFMYFAFNHEHPILPKKMGVKNQKTANLSVCTSTGGYAEID
jgi:hypothetical protein